MSGYSTQTGLGRSEDGPLFVVGVPRSGTSLLHVLLNQHPDIGLMFEADLPLLWPLFVGRANKWRWLKRWNLWNKSVERHQIDITKIPEQVADVCTATQLAYEEYASHKSASIWGDKSPDQYDTLVKVAEYFPKARFIIIWRDPADVCRSMIRARKGSFRFRQSGMTHRALLGYEQLGKQRDLLVRRGNGVHELQYESLVANTADVMRGICKFLDIPFHPAMATLRNADRTAVHAAEHNAMVNGERIVASRKYDEVLAPKLKRKIDRYKARWRQKNVSWPQFSLSEGAELCVPSLFEKAIDQLRYKLFRLWDLFIVFAFCYAPVSFLVAYRSRKGHPYVNAEWDKYIRHCMETAHSNSSSIEVPLEATLK